MKYLSFFSGIGGLESSTLKPSYLCESDPACRLVLSERFPDTELVDNIHSAPIIKTDAIVGGWPCQDLTSAGRQRGLSGSNSSLFFRMVEIAKSSKANTIVGENVPNLRKLRRGAEFRVVIETLINAGFGHVSWRSLNAREFGLPQDRNRLLIIASKTKHVAMQLHRSLTKPNRKYRDSGLTPTSGFYWTGGKQSICYSENFVPALKVGSSPPKGGTSPVAVFYRNVVRKLTPKESIGLQGFSWRGFDIAPNDGDVYRMAGNAVPKPMGNFAVDSIASDDFVEADIKETRDFSLNGYANRKALYEVVHATFYTDNALSSFIDLESTESLSPQAAAGLLTRLIRSNRLIPTDLFDALYELSLRRTPLRGTKVDSFSVLHEQLNPLKYRANLEV